MYMARVTSEDGAMIAAGAEQMNKVGTIIVVNSHGGFINPYDHISDHRQISNSVVVVRRGK